MYASQKYASYVIPWSWQSILITTKSHLASSTPLEVSLSLTSTTSSPPWHLCWILCCIYLVVMVICLLTPQCKHHDCRTAWDFYYLLYIHYEKNNLYYFNEQKSLETCYLLWHSLKPFTRKINVNFVFHWFACTLDLQKWIMACVSHILNIQLIHSISLIHNFALGIVTSIFTSGRSLWSELQDSYHLLVCVCISILIWINKNHYHS